MSLDFVNKEDFVETLGDNLPIGIDIVPSIKNHLYTRKDLYSMNLDDHVLEYGTMVRDKPLLIEEMKLMFPEGSGIDVYVQKNIGGCILWEHEGPYQLISIDCYSNSYSSGVGINLKNGKGILERVLNIPFREELRTRVFLNGTHMGYLYEDHISGLIHPIAYIVARREKMNPTKTVDIQ